MSINHSPRNPRVFEDVGRAQTAADFEPPDWNETRYIAAEFADEVRYWQPGAKKKSFENGDIFAYRILPEVASADCAESFPPGRRADGSLSVNAVWPINVIDKFGFERKISFIPTLPYVPSTGRYERYAGPYDNPYRLLTTWLWNHKGKRLPQGWTPLVMTTDEIAEYRKRNGLWNAFFSTLLLPLPKFRYFSYALLYRGYDTGAERDFEFDGEPFGAGPDDGLQIVSVNQQVYEDLRREYGRKARSASVGVTDEFYFPDPADPGQGTINHIRNRNYPNPVDENAGKPEGFGYFAAVESRYHRSPTQFRDVDLRLEPSFLDRYYDRWQPWWKMLAGTTGAEQVALIARYAPELRGPCERAWERHPVLMEAWQESFAGAPDDYDFRETLDLIFGANECEPGGVPEKGTSRHRPAEPEAKEPVDPPPDPVPEEMPPRRQAQTLSRVDMPDVALLAGRSRQPNTVGPLQAVGDRIRSGLFPEQEDFEDDPNDDPAVPF